MTSLTGGVRAILWIDLETTGTDKDRDEIIEIGAILTTIDMETVIAEKSWIVMPGAVAYFRLFDTPIVKEMHTKNGLMLDIAKGISDMSCMPMPVVEKQVAAWVRWVFANHDSLKKYANNPRCILAGSGVSHFDRLFIKKQMPAVESMLAYPMLDVGVIRRFLRFANIIVPAPSDDTKNHRALDDIRLHLSEAQAYVKALKAATNSAV